MHGQSPSALQSRAPQRAGRNRRRDPARARSALVGTPREVLARLVNEDPLELRRVVAQRLGDRHLLMDADLVLDRVRARCAQDALRWRGVPSIETWIEERVDGVLDRLREQTPESLPEEHCAGAFLDLAQPLQLTADELQAGCARFNLRSDEERELFFRLVLERRSPGELARERGRSLTSIAVPARRALDALLGGDRQVAPGMDSSRK